MKRQDEMPELVYWGLYGLSSRKAAAAFMWGCLLIGAVSILGLGRTPAAGWGVALLPAAAWYWYSIRWVDQNSSWEPDAQQRSLG